MLLSDLVAELEHTAEAAFTMFWVSGWQRLPEESFDAEAEEDGEGPYRARLAVPLIGVGRTDDQQHVLFMRERVRNDSMSP